MYSEKIVDAETGQETWREYTQFEIAEVEKEKELIEAELTAQLEKEQAKLAILEKLGLTAEEAVILLG